MNTERPDHNDAARDPAATEPTKGSTGTPDRESTGARGAEGTKGSAGTPDHEDTEGSAGTRGAGDADDTAGAQAFTEAQGAVEDETEAGSSAGERPESRSAAEETAESAVAAEETTEAAVATEKGSEAPSIGGAARKGSAEEKAETDSTAPRPEADSTGAGPETGASGGKRETGTADTRPKAETTDAGAEADSTGGGPGTGASSEEPDTGTADAGPTAGTTPAEAKADSADEKTTARTNHREPDTGTTDARPTAGTGPAEAGVGSVGEASGGGFGGRGSAAGVASGGHGEVSVSGGDGRPGRPRPVRRRSPVVIASVAAAVLLVGGGGAYLTASLAGGSGGGSGAGVPGADGTPSPLVLDGYSSGASEGGSNGIAPGEPNPYGVIYRAEGSLPEGPGSAAVYWAEGEVGKAQVTRLAQALGIDGTPVVDGAAWRVGAGQDGSGPVLRVDRQAPGMWTYTSYTPGTDDCRAGAAECRKDPASPAGDPVSEAVARKAAAPILKAVGQDAAKVDASQVMGAQRVVNADPVVGGLPTYGWATGISVNAEGEVVGGNGRLDTPVKGDSYPVLGAEETLAALNNASGTVSGAGIGGCATPVPAEDGVDGPCEPSTIAPQKATLVVEDAVFGLAPHTSGGQPVLVPSWLFAVRAEGAANDYTMTYPAVEPQYLTSASATATQPPGEPTTEPSPRPTGPGDQPTASSAPRDVQVEGYTADGKELTVAFTGGVCSDYEAKAVESAGKVTVTVTETHLPGKVCILIAKQFHRTVQLDEPLGSRKVVGSDGQEIPLEKAGARLPDMSTDQPQ